MSKRFFKRYIWLVDTVRSAGTRGITYKEINEKWLHSSLNDDGSEYALRTFHDHMDAVSEMFDIDIVCDRRDNTYHIEDVYDEYGSMKKSLIDAMVLNNTIKENPGLTGCVVFNDNFMQNSLPELLRAVKYHITICFRYHRDYSHIRRWQTEQNVPTAEQTPDEDRAVEFEPYGLYFNTVWFVVGNNISDGRIHVYTLHRMNEINFLDRSFSVPDGFDVKQYVTGFVDDEELEPYPGREPDDAFTLESFEAGKDSDMRM